MCSRYNHLVQVSGPEGAPRHIVVNTFYATADFVGERTFGLLEKAERAGVLCEDEAAPEMLGMLAERGYLCRDWDAEEELVQNLGANFADRDQIAARLGGGQYGFITSLFCNLGCPYCFQQKHADSTGFLSKALIDRGIAAIEICETRVREICGNDTLPKISITGGEPMLPNAENIEALDHLIDQLVQRCWPFNITCNGTELARFVNTHPASKSCRNIQVTLDGPRHVHDRRRAFRGGRGSFDRIVEGIEAALHDGWPLTLRVNLDMSNTEHVPELARFILDRHWLDKKDFAAYLSPVTDHGPIDGRDLPSDEADLLEALLDVATRFQEVLRVFSIKHFRGFDYVERLLNENPRYPVIHRCEASTGMYIFDPLGDVHVCLEAVGDRNLRVGTYHDGLELDRETHDKWAGRNVLTLDKCTGCKVRFLCAGGCTLESFNRCGRESCMPFLREMDIAWNYFARTRPELFR